MRLEGLHRASITESPLCGISVATQLPHNPRLKLLRFSERRLSWRITALSEKWCSPQSERVQSPIYRETSDVLFAARVAVDPQPRRQRRTHTTRVRLGRPDFSE